MIKEDLKNFDITIEGTWYEVINTITGKIIKYGDCEKGTQKEAEGILKNICKKYSMKESSQEIIKRVIWNPIKKDFEQLQAIKYPYIDTYTLQYFNSNMEYIDEIDTYYKYDWEVLESIRKKEVVKGLRCSVLRDFYIGDCTNNGISKNNDKLILIGREVCKLNEVEDLRDCVQVDSYENFVSCKPIIYNEKWYMAGGNFLYSSDSRFHEINQYPISIHDRLE